MYITKNNLEKFHHLQVPRKIWEMFLKKELSEMAFKLYVEFFDRLKLSAYNNWVDKEGNVYIKYSYEEMMGLFNVTSRGTISKAVKALKEKQLIMQVKGFNTSSIFYLSNVLAEENQQSSTLGNTVVHSRKLSSPLSETQKSASVDANHNNLNNNNLNHNNPSAGDRASLSEEEKISIRSAMLKAMKLTPVSRAMSRTQEKVSAIFIKNQLYPLAQQKGSSSVINALNTICAESRADNINDLKGLIISKI